MREGIEKSRGHPLNPGKRAVALCDAASHARSKKNVCGLLAAEKADSLRTLHRHTLSPDMYVVSIHVFITMLIKLCDKCIVFVIFV